MEKDGTQCFNSCSPTLSDGYRIIYTSFYHILDSAASCKGCITVFGVGEAVFWLGQGVLVDLDVSSGYISLCCWKPWKR